MFLRVFRFILIVCSFIINKSKVILSIFLYFIAFIYFLTQVLQFFLLIARFIAFITAFYLHSQPVHSIFMIFEWIKADFLPLIFSFVEIKLTNDYVYRCYWKIIPLTILINFLCLLFPLIFHFTSLSYIKMLRLWILIRHVSLKMILYRNTTVLILIWIWFSLFR
jgi:hypothetical protein